MSNYIQRLVSGNKARFKDKQLGIELDLVYLTNNLIIMGFPASGVEGVYRNHRDEAKRFLEQRHGKNYWVFNFCPVRENSYPVSFFDGRVTRYPFPDHHAPPLSILALAARDIREWLFSSPDNVAVLHCKAGKGRSGTLACAYLLCLNDFPSTIKPDQRPSISATRDWANLRADRLLDAVEMVEMENPDPQDDYGQTVTNDFDRTKGQCVANGAAASLSVALEDQERWGNNEQRSHSEKLESILALHTEKRMRRPSSPHKKQSLGVSIPSQRRWLHYWSLILANKAPPGFWSIPQVASQEKVCIRQITIRMRELTRLKKNLLKFANSIAVSTNSKHAKELRMTGQVWASIARYDDDFVTTLEKWEKHTRGVDGDFGTRRHGSEILDGENICDMFVNERWDSVKMVKSFSKMGNVDAVGAKERTAEGTIITWTLKTLSQQSWRAIEAELTLSTGQESIAITDVPNEDATFSSESSSDLARIRGGANDYDIILDAQREVRVKLYFGRVFMGWFWFIPAFHIPQPTSPSVNRSTKPEQVHLTLSRKELDFPIGVGSYIIDVDVAMERVHRAR